MTIRGIWFYTKNFFCLDLWSYLLWFQFNRVFIFFCRYSTWQKAVRHIASLDCLMSLAIYSKNIGDSSCRPEIVDIIKSDGTERKVSAFDNEKGIHFIVDRVNIIDILNINPWSLFSLSIISNQRSVTFHNGPNFAWNITQVDLLPKKLCLKEKWINMKNNRFGVIWFWGKYALIR